MHDSVACDLDLQRRPVNSRDGATIQGVLTLHGGRHDVALTAQGQLVGDNLTATAHFSVPYVEWGMEDPSILFLTVAKKVDIDIVTSGNVAWKSDPAESPHK